MTDLGLSTVVTREVRRSDNEHRVLGTGLGIGFLLAVVAIGLGLGLMSLIYAGPGNAAVRQAIVILMVQVLVAPLKGSLARSSPPPARLCDRRRRRYPVGGHGGVHGDRRRVGLGYHAVLIAIGASYVVQAVVITAIALGPCADAARTMGGRRLIALALPLGGVLLLTTCTSVSMCCCCRG